MRPSILPTIALALILAGAGAFGAWFVLSQEDSAPPPIAAINDTADKPDRPARHTDGIVDRTADVTTADTPDTAVTPKPANVEAAKKPVEIEGGNRLGPNNAAEAGRIASDTARRDAEKAALDRAAKEIGLDEILAPEELLGNGEKEPFSATISGTVTDNKGTPISGASVYGDVSELREMTSKGGARMAFSTSFASDAAPRGTPIATTDSSGNFTAQISREVGKNTRVNVSITAKAEGHAVSKPQSFALKNGETKEGVKLGLRGAGSVSGRVVDQSGRGVDGATVSISAGGGATYMGGADLPVSFGGGGQETAVTDSGGNFKIEGVAEGRYTPRVRATGWRQISGPTEVSVTEGNDAKFAPDFVMAAAASMKVKLTTAEGQAAVNYYTAIFKDGSNTLKTMGGMAGADGTLTLNDVPAGSLTVEIRAHNIKPITLSGSFNEGQPTDLGTHTVEKTDPKAGNGGYGGGTIIVPGENG